MPQPTSHARRLFGALLATVTLVIGLPFMTGVASAQTPPATRYSALVQGDFTVTGNTLNTCCFDASDQDSDGPGGFVPTNANVTNTSSRASFSIPTGASVTKAFLYVLVNSDATLLVPSTMEFGAPGSDYVDVAMTDIGEDGGGRVVVSDVTTELAAAGAGNVWVGAPNSFGAPEHLHSWGMYVVYSSPTLPWRQVVLVDQASMIDPGLNTTMSATINDLAVAPGGSADATLAVFEFYSSGGSSNRDTLQVCAGTSVCPDSPSDYGDPAVYAQNGPNPYDDVANSTFTLDGAPMPDTSPSPTFLWSDLDLFQMPGALPSGTTSATVTARSLGDTVFSGFIALSTTVYAPIAQLTNIPSGVAAPGGFVDYELTYDLDAAGDDAQDVVLNDLLPSNVTYVPGSAQIVAGANAGPVTDATGDDQLDASGASLNWRIGTGATDAVGGSVLTTDGPQTLRFRVQVDAGAVVGDPIVNGSSSSFHGVSSPTLDYNVIAMSNITVVAFPAAPTPSDMNSSAPGPDVQSETTPVPVGGSATLLVGSTPQTTVAVTGQGTYTIDTATGEITFTPIVGYWGTPTPVAFRVTDAFAGSGDAVYEPVVTRPAAPTATPRTSSGTGTAAQTTTIAIPANDTIILLDGSSATDTVTVAGQGTYTLDPLTGVITFTPVLGFHAAATPVNYRLDDAYAQSASSTYTPTVNSPATPTAIALTSSDSGPNVQHVTPAVPASGAITLRIGSTSTNTVVVADQGTYTLDPATHEITFTPLPAFSGIATPVEYRVADAYGQVSANATYTPTVFMPEGPDTVPVASTGVGIAPQIVTLPIPANGSVTLLDGTTPVTTLTVDGEGVYVLDPATGQLTFTPELGFTGIAASIAFRIADAYAQPFESTYTSTVTTPAAPTAPTMESEGPQGVVQRVTIVIPAGGTVTLMNGATPVTSLTVAGEGTYSLDPATGVITFTPLAAYFGTPTAVTYVVTDAYAQSTSGSFAPEVLGATQTATTTTTAAPAAAAATGGRGGVVPVTSPLGSATPLAFTGGTVWSLLLMGLVLVVAGAAAVSARHTRGLRRRPVRRTA